MKACREAKRIIAKMRRRIAGKNGVIPSHGFDHPALWRLFYNSKRIHPRAAKAHREPA